MYLTDECRDVAAWMERKAKEKIDDLKENGRDPGALAFVADMDDPATASYVRAKEAACKRVGLRSVRIPFDYVREEMLVLPPSAGVILQAPYPQDVWTGLAGAIWPKQDVDGMFYTDGPCISATALGIYFLLRYLYGDLPTGRPVTVLGRSKAVGWPIADMLCRQLDMEVTVVHSKTAPDRFRSALLSQFIVSCIGKPGVVIKEWNVQSWGTYIDVGFARDENGRPVGDVAPELADDIYKNRVTPVPGGVGPLTVAALMLNAAYRRSPFELWTAMRDEIGDPLI